MYFTNLALAYQKDNQLPDAILTIDQMTAQIEFADLRKSESYQKGQLIKARCLMLQVKEYCFGSSFDQASNRIHHEQITSAVCLL